MWQIATDKKHGRAIVALDQFLMDASPDDAAQYMQRLDLSEDRTGESTDTATAAAAAAAAAATTTTTSTTTTTTATDDTTVVSEPPQGFGQAKRKPKGKGEGKPTKR